MRALVVGGAGNLGRSFVSALNKAGYQAINLDLKKNPDARSNIILDASKNMSQQMNEISAQISDDLKGNKLSSVFCAAGGWREGSIRDDNFFDALHQMQAMNVDTAALSCHLASKYVVRNGLVLLTGASVALHPTPSILAYGLSKTATHFMVESVARDSHFLKNKICVVGVLPQVIDTNDNRERLTDDDKKDWTKPDELAEMCVAWVTEDDYERPKTGSLLNVRSSYAESAWIG
mmetsp:Transcript_2023/g.2107  ORF Transcript_2023/g.2107 Transcript_2023/m.2107 type:complete len:234 (+) Transcript_2023:155-856(+)